MGKQSRALNVRYFFISDQVNQGNLNVKYCRTDEMIGDSMTKPLQGSKFMKFRKIIMGETLFRSSMGTTTGVCWKYETQFYCCVKFF